MEEQNNTISGKPGKRDRFLAVSILVAALVVGGSVVFAAVYKGGSAGTGGGNGTAKSGVSAASAAAVLALNSHDVILGNSNAPVTVIEYGDYQCPYCVLYFSQVQPQIISKYVDTGKVKMVFRNFPFVDRFPGVPAGENESHDAAMAALCAQDQNQFWAYHDGLYDAKAADNAKGGSEDKGFFTRALFLGIATKLKLDVPAFTSCIDSKKYAAQVDQEYSDATKAGVDSTPVTFVDGTMVQILDPQTQQYESAGADGTTILQAIATAVAGK